MKKTVNSNYAVLIIALCAGFLFYKYVLQIYPSIITDHLMREFHLTGAGLGNLAATFYYAYMITQLFVGVLLDKYSVRWLNAAAIFICALGLYVFSQTQNLLTAELSRALMGAGAAFATVSYMKLAAVWFKPEQYAFIGGLLATAAMSGAVFGEAPLSFFISHFGWRQCLCVTALAGLGLTILFALWARDAPDKMSYTNAKLFLNAESEKPEKKVSFSDIIEVLKSRQNWLLTLYSGLAFAPIAIFGGLWGTPFLEQAYGLDKTQAASMLSLVFIGLGIGSPLLGMLSDRLKSRRNMMFFFTLSGCAAMLWILYGHPEKWLLCVLLFTFGFVLGVFMLAFTIGKELNKIALAATVIAMINTSDAVLDAVTEPLMGKLLDLNWDGKMAAGVHYFSLHSYHIGLAVLPLYLFTAALLLLGVKKDAAN